MAQKVVVIGGVALGPKAACRCLRLSPETELTLVDENFYISYGGCGLPYYVSGEIQSLDALRSTNYQVIRDPEFFAKFKGFQVLNQTRALAIDRSAQTVKVKNLLTGAESLLPYDQLVLATGARPKIPDLAGKDLGNVFTLTKLEAASEIRKACASGEVAEAVIVGGGFIGLEAAVALADMWDIKVTVIEASPSVLHSVLPQSLSLIAEHDLAKHKVNIIHQEKIKELIGEKGKVCQVVTEQRQIPAQMVLLATGFTPNTQLAKDCGLKTTANGAILVDESLRTSDPKIFAGGDCAATKNLITGKAGYLPLGSLSNRQGRVIGTNLAGGTATFKGHVGTWCIKLFEQGIASTGLTIEQARRAGFDAISVFVEQLDRAHFYPEKEMMALEIVVDKNTRKVLGLQGASLNIHGVKARIDAVASALQFSEVTIDDISNLEVAYAPPFAAAMDVVNVVANVADNVLAGRFKPITATEFVELWQKRADNQIFFIDARPAKAGSALEAAHADWHCLPLEELPERFKEIPSDREIAIICNTGLRAYESILLLAKHGLTNVVNVQGGMQAVKQMGLLAELN
ncbi:MAG: FAD-dependent oxidoreductase [Desulfovibrio sp.]|nr:FAD-dependent oxidoreductase [Desulfovibrio sp.]